MSRSNGSSKRVECLVVREGGRETVQRDLVGEEPLRVLVNGEPAATLMRTPGDETDLAAGFLLTEGLIRSRREILAMSYSADVGGPGVGVVRIRLADKVARGVQRRYRDVFSSCSLCGIDALEAFAEGLPRFEGTPGRLRSEDVFGLRDAMEAAQRAFHTTGGTHAAAVAELPLEPGAERVVVREDLGRHNALDKAVGAASVAGFDPGRCLLLTSGRLSLEMVAKSARAGIGNLAGVSAPSALGVEIAERLAMFLAAFVRGATMTVYVGVKALQETREA